MPKPKPKKSRRAARGTGTVFFDRRRNRYVARRVVGGARGKTRYVERTGRTQAEAIAKLARATPPQPGGTVAEWAARWLDGIGLRPASVRSYTVSVTHHIVPALGRLRLRDVTAHDVERAAAGWGKGLGPNSVLLVLKHLRACLGAAVRAGLIPRNPVPGSRKPKAVKKKIDPFPPAEIVRVVAAAAGKPNTRVVALLAATGMRDGEALALDVADYDPAAGTVSVTKTLGVKRRIGPPKSKNSERVIRVPLGARPALDAAIGSRKDGPLFVTKGGRRQVLELVRRPWVGLLAKLGLAYRNLHQLRHSVATAMLGAGDAPADVAKYLGDTVETVISTYCHPTGADSSATMDRLFAGPQGGLKVADSGKVAASTLPATG